MTMLLKFARPRGGPGMQEMLYPTSYIKSKGLGKACALLTDGRFSGGTSGLSIGHASPEAAAAWTVRATALGAVAAFLLRPRTLHPSLADMVMEVMEAMVDFPLICCV